MNGRTGFGLCPIPFSAFQHLRRRVDARRGPDRRESTRGDRTAQFPKTHSPAARWNTAGLNPGVTGHALARSLRAWAAYYMLVGTAVSGESPRVELSVSALGGENASAAEVVDVATSGRVVGDHVADGRRSRSLLRNNGDHHTPAGRIRFPVARLGVFLPICTHPGNT